MSKIFGIVMLFAAAWLMVRLQAGSGSCCGGGYDRHGSDLDHEQVGCVDMSTGLGHARNEEGGRGNKNCAYSSSILPYSSF